MWRWFYDKDVVPRPLQVDHIPYKVTLSSTHRALVEPASPPNKTDDAHQE